MRVSQAVRQRISTRAFLARTIPEEEIRAWLKAAQRAPSGGNLQPWRVIVLAGQAKEAVTQLAARQLKANPHGQETDRPIYPPDLWEPYETRRKTVGEQMYARLGIAREDGAARRSWFASNFSFFGAPAGLFVILDTRMGYGQWAHAGMYLQTLALLAEENGWATCMQECWAMIRPALKTHLKLGEREMVWCGMALGWPDRSAAVNSLRTERAGLDEVAEFHGF